MYLKTTIKMLLECQRTCYLQKKIFYHEKFQNDSDLLATRISWNNLFTIDMVFVDMNLIIATWQNVISSLCDEHQESD